MLCFQTTVNEVAGGRGWMYLKGAGSQQKSSFVGVGKRRRLPIEPGRSDLGWLFLRLSEAQKAISANGSHQQVATVMANRPGGTPQI